MKKWLAMTSLSEEMTSSLYSCYNIRMNNLYLVPMCVYVRERGEGERQGESKYNFVHYNIIIMIYKYKSREHKLATGACIADYIFN